MGSDVALLKFLEITYIPNHKHIPGYIGITCLIKEWELREKERGYTFQYDRGSGKVFFRVYPIQIQLSVGEATNLNEAIEQAKQFLTKWLGDDVQFRLMIAEEIQRLEQEKRSATQP